jgi:hypothetical protein
VVEPVLQGALGWFARGFQDSAIHVKTPEMIAAPYPCVTNQDELQRGTPVRAVEFQQPHPTTLITKDDQILSQNAYPHRQVVQRIGPDHWMPEAAQIFSARCAGPNVGKFLVFPRNFIVEIPAVWDGQKGGSGRHHASPLSLAASLPLRLTRRSTHSRFA